MPSPSHAAIAPVVSPRRLWIKPQQQKPYMLTVDANDTMYTIKSRVENRDGHCRDQQRLIYGGRELEDNIVLKDCGVLDDDATFNLVVEKTHRIVIKLRSLYGKQFDLTCESKETINQVKVRIEQLEAIAAEKQRLVFTGKELQDEWTLDECGVKNGSLVMMVARGSTLTSRKMQAESRPKRKPMIKQEPQAAPSVRGLPRKRGADDELSEDHKSLAKMIKIEKDLGSESFHSAGSTSSASTVSDHERDEDEACCDSRVMDSPSINSATQRSDLAENPPFLGGNFFGIMPDYADGSEHGANFEWEMLLAPVPNSEKKMASAKKAMPWKIYADTASTKIGNPLERSLSPVQLDVLTASNCTNSSQDARKKRSTSLVKSEAPDEDGPVEEKMVKRMQKNRASAERSRQRKQAYLEEVEFKLSVATSENLTLRERIDELEGKLQRFQQLFGKLSSAGLTSKLSPSGMNFVTPNKGVQGLGLSPQTELNMSQLLPCST